MKKLESYQSCTPAELTEMIEEAKRAKRIIEANTENGFQIEVQTRFFLGKADILTIHTETNQGFVLAELNAIIDLLDSELTKKRLQP